MLEPVVPIPDPNTVEATYAAYIRDWEARNGRRAPNNVLVMAHSPDLGLATRKFLEAMSLASLPSDLRFLVRYVVSNPNQCRYCTAHQIEHLARAGLPAEKIKAASDFEASPRFTAAEKAAMGYARALTRDAGSVPSQVIDRLLGHFTPQERVELTLIVGAMNLVNMFNDGLRVPLEEDAVFEL